MTPAQPVRTWHTLRTLPALWCLLAFAHLAYSLFLSPHMYFSEDDVLYQFMSMSAARYGSLFVMNGYQDLPSLLFTYMFFYIPAPNGQLAAQFPPLFPLLGAPLTLLLGTKGLFALNALLHLLNALLTFRIARLMFGDRAVAHTAALLYAFGTFAWAYSQTSLAHTQASTLILSTYYAMLLAIGGTRTREWRLGLCSGLLFGAGVATRIDSFFAAAGIGALLLYTAPLRWRAIIAFGGGLTSVLVLQTLYNHLRFGIWKPLAYSAAPTESIFTVTPYIIPAVALGIIVGFPWLWHITTRNKPKKDSPLWVAIPLALVLGAALLTPVAIHSLSFFVWNHATDVSNSDLYEKAILQCVPFFALLPLSCWLAWPNRPHRRAILLLLVIPLLYTMIFGMKFYPAYMHYYQRFFTPTLPFLSIACAYGIVHLLAGSSHARTATVGVAVALIATAWLWWSRASGHHEQTYMLLMQVPLALCLLIALLTLLITAATRIPALARVRKLAGYAAIATVAWGGATLAFDHARVRSLRTVFDATAEAARHVAPGALVVVGNNRPRYRQFAEDEIPVTYTVESDDRMRTLPAWLDVPDVRIALYPPRDILNVPPEEIVRLFRFFGATRPLYTYWLSDDVLAALRKAGYRIAVASHADSQLLRWESTKTP